MKKRLVPASLILVMALGVTARTLPSSAPAGSPLAGKVVIRRDTYGIPHILAETEEAAAFGFGYAQAEDHCLTIARSLVAARGEEAKYFGTGKESDFLIRLYNVREEAERDLRRVSRLYRRIVNAYAMGVNRYVERHRAELPDWIPAFTGADLMAARRAGAVRSAFSQAAVRALRSWDNRVAAESRGAVLFQRFWDTYSRAVEQPYAAPWDPQRPAQTPYGLADTAAALKHLEDAVRWCRQAYGSEDVAWGEVHRFRFGALDLPGDGANGTYGLFRVVRFQELPDGKRVAGRIRENEPPIGFGDAWVLAVEFSRPVRARSILAYGQTTRSASKHSSDQIGLFASHRLRPVWFTEEEIRANLESEYRP